MDQQERNDLQEIIDKALADMGREAGKTLAPEEVNLAEFCRRTGLSRSKARTLKGKGFKALPHGRCGMKAETTVMSGYEEEVDRLLRQGVTNSEVCYDRIREKGYEGGLTTVKNYIADHKGLVPAQRKLVAPQSSRGTRFKTEPGESFQMDWGFLNVVDWLGGSWRIACFAMVCHACGSSYVEFFPNARQESLFIGMLRGFMALGVPDFVLTDNMKSVVLRRDLDGRPVWQADYAAFMATVGFKTKLCKPRHPFTKGKVERLVRFVKSNFAAGREFVNITRFNEEAAAWCAQQASRYHRAVDCVPAEKHSGLCLPASRALAVTDDVAAYLCPRRKVSFDGFVCYEGRRFGVPYWYAGRECRVSREGGVVHVYSDDLSRELAAHDATWSRADSFCEDQYADVGPVELPTAPVTVAVAQPAPRQASPLLAKFDFGREA